MANTILTISMITRRALMVLENNLTFTKYVTREYDDQYARSGAKIGDTLQIRLPARYTVRQGPTLAVQDHTETQVPLVLNTQNGVDVQFTTKEMALDLDDFSERVLEPQIATLANRIDFDGLQLYQSVYNTVGTPGVTPNALLTYLQAKEKLMNEATPSDDQLSQVINPAAEAAIVDALGGRFQDSTQISQQYRQGKMGIAAGFKWSMDQNIAVHTVGNHGGTPLVNGAAQTGSSLVTDGWPASVTGLLNAGDVFTIAGVNAVNPQSRQDTGQLRQFVVTANVDSDAGGNATIPISPPMTATGAFQTITALAADNAAITVLGTAGQVTPQNMSFHKGAFALGTADLYLPQGTDRAARAVSRKLGISIRMIRDYDINTDNVPCRLDVLYGWVAQRPELACRVAG